MSWTTSATDRLTLDLMAQLEVAQIASRMRQARRGAGLTQQELADVLSVHKRTVENVERAQVKPYDYIRAWSEATEKSVAWLLHGRELEATQPDDRLAAVLELEHATAVRLDALEAALDRIESLLQGEQSGQ